VRRANPGVGSVWQTYLGGMTLRVREDNLTENKYQLLWGYKGLFFQEGERHNEIKKASFGGGWKESGEMGSEKTALWGYG